MDVNYHISPLGNRKTNAEVQISRASAAIFELAWGSADYFVFMKAHNLVPSMSRRGNCHNNAVAESFFSTIKKRHSHTGGVSAARGVLF